MCPKNRKLNNLVFSGCINILSPGLTQNEQKKEILDLKSRNFGILSPHTLSLWGPAP